MNKNSRIQFARVEEEVPGLDFLLKNFTVSNASLALLLELGAIYVNQRRWNPGEMPNFHAESLVRIHLEPKRFSKQQLSKIQILEETPDWVAIWKPAGVPSHPTLDNVIENTLAETSDRLKRPLWALTRLDVGTRGVLMFAKSAKAARELNSVSLPAALKTYRSLSPSPQKPLGLWQHWMKKSDRAPREVRATIGDGFELECLLEIKKREPLAFAPGVQQEILLKTGRTHQIRVQMQAEGAPLWGDTLYGSEIHSPCSWEEFALSCESLEGAFEGRRFQLQRPSDILSLEDVWSSWIVS